MAQTPNQIASAGALQAGGAAGGSLFSVVLNSTSVANALAAFDASSGEIHATLQAAQFENATATQRQMLGRMRHDNETGWSLWGNVSGNWGSMDGDGNAASASAHGVAITLGADAQLSDNWRGGFTGGYAASNLNVVARASGASLTSGQFGVYAHGRYDALTIRTGFAYGVGTADTLRGIGFSGFTDAASASQDLDSQQLFGEVAYGFALDGITIEPFAGLSWTRIHAGAFRESGGSAALGGSASGQDDGFATLGAQLFTGGWDFAGGLLTPNLRMGWQHAFSNNLASRSLSFLSTGQAFTVLGTPLDADRALWDLDASLALGANTKATLGYSGSLSAHVEDHAVRLMVSVGL